MGDYDALKAMQDSYSALTDKILEALKTPKTMAEVPDAPLRFDNMENGWDSYFYTCKNGYRIRAERSGLREGEPFFQISFFVRDSNLIFGARDMTEKEARELLNEERRIYDAPKGEVEYYMNLLNKLPQREGINDIQTSGSSLYGLGTATGSSHSTGHAAGSWTGRVQFNTISTGTGVWG